MQRMYSSLRLNASSMAMPPSMQNRASMAAVTTKWYFRLVMGSLESCPAPSMFSKAPRLQFSCTASMSPAATER